MFFDYNIKSQYERNVFKKDFLSTENTHVQLNLTITTVRISNR